jgi:hypothetical protein
MSARIIPDSEILRNRHGVGNFGTYHHPHPEDSYRARVRMVLALAAIGLLSLVFLAITIAGSAMQ